MLVDPKTQDFAKSDYDTNVIATQPSVYDNPSTAKFFQPHPRYENLHRFDPNFRWTWGEEPPLITKMDLRITFWACIAFFALDLPRGNFSQANSASFLQSLRMDKNDYNLGNTVFQISFLCAELPSQMISKKLRPDRWVPFIMCSWSIVSGCQFWLSGRTSFLICRALLGILQGGFIPGIFTMAASPTQTKAWWRPKGWFNEHKENILVNRILRDDPSKSDMHNRQAITPKLLLKSLADYELELGFNTNDANLLRIPSQFLGVVFMLIMTYLSEIWDTRALFGAFTQLWYLPNLVAIAVLPSNSSP
ncbi:hypothetical protein LZ31DRAFT_562157 [Colletotrichum somersetense]|nr:hypothetical protein LZ31DRAFT_562157 [Colletotrichum somersetense]